MEEWQEEITIKTDLYFVGKASMKYVGTREDNLSEESGFDHFVLNKFYEIEINNVKKVGKRSYKNKPELVKIENVDDPIFVNRKEGSYQIEPLEFYLAEENPTPAHEQIEEGEAYGHFEKVLVKFKLIKEEKKVFYKQGFPTRNTKIVDGDLYIEYYNIDGSTYWERDNAPSPQPSPQPKPPPPAPPPPSGCFDGFTLTIGVVLQVILAAVALYFIIKYYLFVPILFVAAIIGFLIGLEYLSQFRFFRGIFRIIGVIFLVFYYGIIALFIGFGIYVNFFESKFKSSGSSSEKTIIKTKSEIEESRKPTWSTIPIDSFSVNVEWQDFSEKHYKGNYKIDVFDKVNSEFNLSNISNQFNRFSDVYNNLFKNDRSHLAQVYRMLDSLRLSNALNKIEFAEVILSLVQNQEYTIVLDLDCAHPSIINNPTIVSLLMEGYECEGNLAYGVKPPTLFFTQLTGDCDTRTLALYTIFKHFNYDVAIINSNIYKHSMLGLNLENIKGFYKLYNGKKYYFCETTSNELKMGQMPPDMKNINFWHIELN